MKQEYRIYFVVLGIIIMMPMAVAQLPPPNTILNIGVFGAYLNPPPSCIDAITGLPVSIPSGCADADTGFAVTQPGLVSGYISQVMLVFIPIFGGWTWSAGNPYCLGQGVPDVCISATVIREGVCGAQYGISAGTMTLISGVFFGQILEPVFAVDVDCSQLVGVVPGVTQGICTPVNVGGGIVSAACI